MKLSSYNYSLPKELIAQEPVKKRDQSRLLVLSRKTEEIQHKKFSDFPDYLNPGDCLVINKTKVVPARLYGKRSTGGKTEVLFLNAHNNNISDRKFLTLVKPYLKPGTRIFFPKNLVGTIEEKTSIGETVLTLSGPPLKEVLEEYGQMPLPPYIKRPKSNESGFNKADKERYQTVFSKDNGSIAAPTAGLHFTKEILDTIRKKGIDICEVTLHVGWGTFKPIRDEDITKHTMLPEHYYIDKSNIKVIEKCIKNDRRIVAVGTTSVRTIETILSKPKGLNTSGTASLFIYPGYKFKGVKALLTNFHLPHSTPLLMVSAFAGRDKILNAYQKAIEKQYRFYSYGDAMLII
ncbi:MAG: tRNA preQ1(34) S-adenosylmethionine ribosyltransferase-isomerase QueA [Endomicrobiales bacterium]|nr:tRNA preQ1(34) S-adenosylmethionine ribosyltransferase-isomerase QueA [Endomicrobiales bacterium]